MSLNRERSIKLMKDHISAAERIPADIIAEEPNLIASKWFEYSFMTPKAATLLFGQLYQREFRARIAKDVDRNLSKNVQGIDLVGITKQPRSFTQLWRARQRADELGVRYQEYLAYCFEFHGNRQRKRLPQPNQLQFTERSELAWLSQFERYWIERVVDGALRLEELPQYKFAAYRGLPAQDSYRNFIIERARESSARWRSVMRAHSVERRELPIRRFVTAVGTDHFRQELRSLRDDGRAWPFQRSKDVDLTEDQLWQSCFGLPHAYTVESPVCSACPQVAGCLKTAGVLIATEN